ncbi:hypothetical protein HYH03_005402 [Edaphochlamys debaryana]|uniref:Caltractin n=1 Tax=Edaphochlamys debaryana TaxID=47281 RepID=A0A835YD03_9CHLO|nr:hypothetical protein HYH03_005402 [Edaphochlamys debaryana]|eukprot:KAG2496580.1 hypothetical protein HYH03_005402 [Edaphochlamys debaryana]
MVDGSGSLDLPQHLKKDLSQINADLYTAVSLWLRKHGKGIKPKLSDDQKQQLKECFELMDQDGSGAIDAEELGAAFKLLGIRMKRSELAALLAEVDHDGSGEVEYPEFLEIMTVTLQRLSEEEDSEKNEGQVPFALMATAYRRKRLMEGIINGDKEVQAQIQQISDKANLEALQATKHAEVEALRAKADASEGGAGRSASTGRTPSGRPIRRIGQVDVNKALLGTLGPDERRIVNALAGKATQPSGGSRAPQPPSALLASARPYGHFSNSPTHRQLMEQPQLLDLRFVHQSTIRLPAGAAVPVRSMSLGPGLGSATGSGPGLSVGGGSMGGGYNLNLREPSLSGLPLKASSPVRRSMNGQPLRGGLVAPPLQLPTAASTWGGGLPSAPSASFSMLSPGRGQRADDVPQRRFEGGAAYAGSKVPMGVRLGTYSGTTERVTRL